MSVALRRRQADQNIIADRRERFQRHVPPALNGLFLGLLHRDGAHQSADRSLVGKDADNIGAPFDLAVQALGGVR